MVEEAVARYTSSSARSSLLSTMSCLAGVPGTPELTVTSRHLIRAYDQANIMFWGVSADINFTLDDYKDDIKKVITDQITTSAIMNRSEQMNNFIKEEFVQVLRRQGAGFVRGRSRFRGVNQHKCGNWEASSIGQLMGQKYVYLGLYDTEMGTAQYVCTKGSTSLHFCYVTGTFRLAIGP